MKLFNFILVAVAMDNLFGVAMGAAVNRDMLKGVAPTKTISKDVFLSEYVQIGTANSKLVSPNALSTSFKTLKHPSWTSRQRFPWATVSAVPLWKFDESGNFISTKIVARDETFVDGTMTAFAPVASVVDTTPTRTSCRPFIGTVDGTLRVVGPDCVTAPAYTPSPSAGAVNFNSPTATAKPVPTTTSCEPFFGTVSGSLRVIDADCRTLVVFTPAPLPTPGAVNFNSPITTAEPVPTTTSCEPFFGTVSGSLRMIGADCATAPVFTAPPPTAGAVNFNSPIKVVPRDETFVDGTMTAFTPITSVPGEATTTSRSCKPFIGTVSGSLRIVGPDCVTAPVFTAPPPTFGAVNFSPAITTVEPVPTSTTCEQFFGTVSGSLRIIGADCATAPVFTAPPPTFGVVDFGSAPIITAEPTPTSTSCEPFVSRVSGSLRMVAPDCRTAVVFTAPLITTIGVAQPSGFTTLTKKASDSSIPGTQASALASDRSGSDTTSRDISQGGVQIPEATAAAISRRGLDKTAASLFAANRHRVLDFEVVRSVDSDSTTNNIGDDSDSSSSTFYDLVDSNQITDVKMNELKKAKEKVKEKAEKLKKLWATKVRREVPEEEPFINPVTLKEWRNGTTTASKTCDKLWAEANNELRSANDALASAFRQLTDLKAFVDENPHPTTMRSAMLNAIFNEQLIRLDDLVKRLRTNFKEAAITPEHLVKYGLALPGDPHPGFPLFKHNFIPHTAVTFRNGAVFIHNQEEYDQLIEEGMGDVIESARKESIIAPDPDGEARSLVPTGAPAAAKGAIHFVEKA